MDKRHFASLTSLRHVTWPICHSFSTPKIRSFTKKASLRKKVSLRQKSATLSNYRHFAIKVSLCHKRFPSSKNRQCVTLPKNRHFAIKEWFSYNVYIINNYKCNREQGEKILEQVLKFFLAKWRFLEEATLFWLSDAFFTNWGFFEGWKGMDCGEVSLAVLRSFWANFRYLYFSIRKKEEQIENFWKLFNYHWQFISENIF